MAGISCSTALSSPCARISTSGSQQSIYLNRYHKTFGVCFSHFQALRSRHGTNRVYSIRGHNLMHRRGMTIKAEVNFVSAEEAKEFVAAEGYAVVDVRDKSQYDRAHIKSSYHVPLFIENKDNDPGTIIKRQLHNNFSGLFYGIPFTKPNPEFVQSVQNQFPPESKILLVCQEGLRSAAAARKLEESGLKNIACLTSGLQSVKPGTFDSVGSTELKDAGKAGLVTIQGKISAVLGTVLICAYLFIQFFPDQAEKLLALAPTG